MRFSESNNLRPLRLEGGVELEPNKHISIPNPLNQYLFHSKCHFGIGSSSISYPNHCFTVVILQLLLIMNLATGTQQTKVINGPRAYKQSKSISFVFVSPHKQTEFD